MIDKTISHYRILEKLGEGGMGIVYKAHDLTLGRTVALKFLPYHLSSDHAEKERFYHEAKTASVLNHPNITTIYEIQEYDDQIVNARQIFIAMEYVEGVTLKTVIRESSSRISDRDYASDLPLNRIMEIAIQISDGLVAAHEKGIIHRDIKSENIMVTPKGQVKIMDFGLAKLKGGAKLTKTGSTLGTAAYMSPEQTRGEEVDHRSDIFSLGVVLYEMLTGRLPFGGEHVAAIQYSIVNEEPFPVARYNDKVSAELQRIVAKSLEKNRDDRYQHIDDMLADLRRERKNFEYARTEYVQPKTLPATALTHPANLETAGITGERGRLFFLKRIKTALVLAGIIVVLLTVFFLVKPLIFNEILVSEPKPIAVIAFINQTGDKAYDYLQDAIPNLLITSLEQSKYLRVMTWERMRDVLKQMGKGEVEQIDRDLGFELCRREGIHAIVLGSFIKAGETFATDVKVLDVSTKELLKSASARGEGLQSILDNQIDELSREISRGVGLSDKTITASAKQITSVTTNSMEAYGYFLKGREQYEKSYWLECLPSLEQAIKIDSTFAMAYLYLARAYSIRANVRESNKNYENAKKYSSKVSEKEKLYIDAAYAGVIEKNPEKRFGILKTIAERFPDEKENYLDLSVYYLSQNKIEESIDAIGKSLALDPNYSRALNQIAYVHARREEYEKALEYLAKYAVLNPYEPDPFDSMGDMYFFIGDIQKAIDNYKGALAIKPEFFSSYKLAYIYALQEDYPAAVEWVDYFFNHSPPSVTMGGVRGWKSFYFNLMGEKRRSDRLRGEAQQLWNAIENRYFVAAMDYFRAWYLLERGDRDSGLVMMERSVRLLNESDPVNGSFYTAEFEMYKGFADLSKGDAAAARQKITKIENLISGISPARRNQVQYEFTLYRANVLLAEQKTDSAIIVAREAVGSLPTSLSGASLVFYTNISSYSDFRDVAARAFLLKKQINDAIAEYEKLTTFDPKSRDRRIISPVYHYKLAKLYEQTGRKDKAVRSYEIFLNILKTADPDIPELIDAKARLGK